MGAKPGKIPVNAAPERGARAEGVACLFHPNLWMKFLLCGGGFPYGLFCETWCGALGDACGDTYRRWRTRYNADYCGFDEPAGIADGSEATHALRKDWMWGEEAPVVSKELRLPINFDLALCCSCVFVFLLLNGVVEQNCVAAEAGDEDEGREERKSKIKRMQTGWKAGEEEQAENQLGAITHQGDASPPAAAEAKPVAEEKGESPKASKQKERELPKASKQKERESPKASKEKKGESPKVSKQKKQESPPRASKQKKEESPRASKQKKERRASSPKASKEKKPEPAEEETAVKKSSSKDTLVEYEVLFVHILPSFGDRVIFKCGFFPSPETAREQSGNHWKKGQN